MNTDSILSKGLILLRRYGAVLVFALILTMVASAAPGILRWRAMNSLLKDNSPMLIMIVGATLPILLGCLDLSIAAMASLAAVVAAMLAPTLGSASAFIVVAGAAVIGGVQGYMIGRLQVPSFVISLGALGIFKGLAMYLTGAAMVGITPGIWIYDLLGGKSAGISNSFLLVLIVAGLLALTLRVTNLGRTIYAFGANEIAVYISGARRDLIRAFAFAVSAACAALGGVMMISQTMFASATMANSLLLPALVGVVVGGTAISGGVGGVLSSLIGGLIAILIRVGVTISGLPPESQDVVFGIAILIAVALTTDRAKIGVVK